MRIKFLTTRIVRAIAVLPVLALVVLSCDGNPAGAGDKTGPDYDPLCTCPCDTEDGVSLRVTYPRGGETFRQGQTLEVGVCEEDTGASGPGALGGYTIEVVVGSYGPKEISDQDGQVEGPRFSWVIPDSLSNVYDPQTSTVTTISTVSDSVRIRVTQYQYVENTSLSERFRIAPR